MKQSLKKPFVNYHQAAFRLPANQWLLAIGAVATGVAVAAEWWGVPFLSWQVPAFLTAGLELLYLAAMPNFVPFIKAVNAREGGTANLLQAQLRSAGMLRQVSRSSMDRYERFLTVRQRIVGVLEERRRSTGFFLEQQATQLDQLEAYYIENLWVTDKLAEHLQEARQNGDVDRQAAQIERDIASSTGRVREMHQQRLELLHKLKLTRSQVLEQRQLASIQLDTMDDTLRYLAEQALTVRTPEELSRHLQLLIDQAEANHAAARDLETLLLPVGA